MSCSVLCVQSLYWSLCNACLSEGEFASLSQLVCVHGYVEPV